MTCLFARLLRCINGQPDMLPLIRLEDGQKSGVMLVNFKSFITLNSKSKKE